MTTKEYDKGIADERARIDKLLVAIREHWVRQNGAESVAVSALDVVSEVIRDGSYVQQGAPK